MVYHYMKWFKNSYTGQIMLGIIILMMVFTLTVICLIYAAKDTKGQTIEELDTKIELLKEEASLLEEYVFGLTNTKEILET